MKILVACEYSGRVRDAFSALGHDAWSVDFEPTDNPDGKHYQGCIKDFLSKNKPEDFDILIAHPPCTYLTCAAEWAYKDPDFDRYPDSGYHQKTNPGILTGEARREARGEAIAFIDYLWQLPIPKKCIENPVGVINKLRPDMPKPQYIQQYEYGENASKKTGLWLDGLQKLIPTKIIEPRIVNGKKRWANQTDSGQNRESPSPDRWKVRSTTPVGIAQAMASQWGDL